MWISLDFIALLYIKCQWKKIKEKNEQDNCEYKISHKYLLDPIIIFKNKFTIIIV